jgi:dihydroflavonol-4-reductase
MSTSLVTGGTGFIGSWVVKTLLERGHHVNATVRSLKNARKCKPLFDLQASHPGKLQLFEADLLKSGSFGDAMVGCSVVYHVASPFLMPQQLKDGVKECIEPALQGTKNVLGSVNETDSVTRVVLTSSGMSAVTSSHIPTISNDFMTYMACLVVAMYNDSIDVTQMTNKTLLESSWNDICSTTNNPYAYSKVLAEKEAWRVCKAQSRWSLVVICPSLVLGPTISVDSIAGSLWLIEKMYHGDHWFGVPDLHMSYVDVRDVAAAHVAAGEDTATKGRYLVASAHTSSLLDLAAIVRPIHHRPRVLPSRTLPKVMIYLAGPFMGLSKTWVDRNIGYQFALDNSRSRTELGIEYRPTEETVKDHYEAWLLAQNEK